MRTCSRHFPGTDSDISDQLARDVADDETRMVSALRELRQNESVSLEAIGFLIGRDPAQISRALKGTASTTLTNYLRIARVLGYRCDISFRRIESASAGIGILSGLKLAPHKVRNSR